MNHTVIVPVKASVKDVQRILFLNRCHGQLYNAALQTMKGRVNQVRRDKRWRELRNQKDSAAKNAAYNKLKEEYGLNEYAVVQAVSKHAHGSKWMCDHVDGRMLSAIGKELWVNVSKWMYGKSEEPRYKPVAARNSLNGNDNQAGLRYADGYILQWTGAIRNARDRPLADKGLRMKVDWSRMPKKRAAYYKARTDTIRKVRLVTEDSKVYAHMIFDCPPYRSKEKLDKAESVKDNTVSFDLGPSGLAYVCPDAQTSGDFRLDKERVDQLQELNKKKRRLNRKLQRSREANNPDCYDGSSPIEGKRIHTRSKAYKRSLAQRQDIYSQETNIVRGWHREIVDTIITAGINIVTEKDTVISWQENGFGKLTTSLAPAALKNAILFESGVLGGSQYELDTYTTYLSQSCICGQRSRKPLNQRKHCCQNEDCLLYGIPLDRDKFSALLGLWMNEASFYKKRDGQLAYSLLRGVKQNLNKFFHTVEHRIVAEEYCSSGSLKRNRGKRFAAKSVLQQAGDLDSMTAINSRVLEKTSNMREADATSFFNDAAQPLSKLGCSSDRLRRVPQSDVRDGLGQTEEIQFDSSA